MPNSATAITSSPGTSSAATAVLWAEPVSSTTSPATAAADTATSITSPTRDARGDRVVRRHWARTLRVRVR